MVLVISKGLQDGVPLAEAVERVFGIVLSKHQTIRYALNSLIKSEVLEHSKEPISYAEGGRSRILIHRDQFDKLHNAVVLQGLFSETKTITAILKDSGKFEYRHKIADFAQNILVGRQSIVGISLLPAEVKGFLEMLGSDKDLATNRLPNPFHVLPQLVLDQGTSVIQQMLAQSSVLSQGDSMMAHYLNDDLESAWQAAQQLDIADPTLGQYKALIEREYREASEFDVLLDNLK
jgi:hypothetical protein